MDQKKMNPENTTLDEWFESYPEARIQALCVALRMYVQQKKKEDKGKEGRQVGALEADCMLEELAEMYPEHAAEAEISFIKKYQEPLQPELTHIKGKIASIMIEHKNMCLEEDDKFRKRREKNVSHAIDELVKELYGEEPTPNAVHQITDVAYAIEALEIELIYIDASKEEEGITNEYANRTREITKALEILRRRIGKEEPKEGELPEAKRDLINILLEYRQFHENIVAGSDERHDDVTSDKERIERINAGIDYLTSK